MKMNVRHLTAPVHITGWPVCGYHRTSLWLIPPEPSHFSWNLLSRHATDNPLPITPETVNVCHLHNLTVRVGGHTVAHTLEHLLPLRAAGLLGLQFQADHCLPYDGCAKTFLQGVRENSMSCQMEVPVTTVADDCFWHYPKKRAGRTAYTKIEPRHDGMLLLHITVDYPTLGCKSRSYTFPDDNLFGRISVARAQGWPRHRYWYSRIMAATGLWLHHDHIQWPQGNDPNVVIDRFLDHRCLDLLGALCLLGDGGWFSATVTSVCSGHVADLEVCKQAWKQVQSVPV